jgi:hypothetical protein
LMRFTSSCVGEGRSIRALMISRVALSAFNWDTTIRFH